MLLERRGQDFVLAMSALTFRKILVASIVAHGHDFGPINCRIILTPPTFNLSLTDPFALVCICIQIASKPWENGFLVWLTSTEENQDIPLTKSEDVKIANSSHRVDVGSNTKRKKRERKRPVLHHC
jgi:hypothetical protein